MIPARPKIPAAIPPTTAPVETFALESSFPLVPVGGGGEGVGVEVLGCVNEFGRVGV